MVASGRTSTLRLFLSSDENPTLNNLTDFPGKLAFLHESNIVTSDSNIIGKLPTSLRLVRNMQKSTYL
jgi:hypothetical protein